MSVALVLHLLHVALGETVTHEFPIALDGRAHDRRISGDRRAVDGEHRRNRELIEQFDEPPEADAIAVFVPGPIRHVGHGRAAGGRRQYGARHRLGEVPLLDIDDDPHHHAGAVRQIERRAVGNRRVGKAVGRQHAPFRSRLWHGLRRSLGHRATAACSCRSLSRRTIARGDGADDRERNRAERQRHEGGPRFVGQVPQRAADGRNDNRAGVADGEHAGGRARHITRRHEQRGNARVGVMSARC